MGIYHDGHHRCSACAASRQRRARLGPTQHSVENSRPAGFGARVQYRCPAGSGAWHAPLACCARVGQRWETVPDGCGSRPGTARNVAVTSPLEGNETCHTMAFHQPFNPFVVHHPATPTQLGAHPSRTIGQRKLATVHRDQSPAAQTRTRRPAPAGRAAQRTAYRLNFHPVVPVRQEGSRPLGEEPVSQLGNSWPCAETLILIGFPVGAGSDSRENWPLVPFPRSVDLAPARNPEPGSGVT